MWSPVVIDREALSPLNCRWSDIASVCAVTHLWVTVNDRFDVLTSSPLKPRSLPKYCIVFAVPNYLRATSNLFPVISSRRFLFGQKHNTNDVPILLFLFCTYLFRETSIGVEQRRYIQFVLVTSVYVLVCPLPNTSRPL